VVSSTWSVKPFRVSGSCCIVYCGFFANIKSMHDLSVPLANVYFAGGPGYNPLSMYQLYYSQIYIIQSAREFLILSKLFLGMTVSFTVGDMSPILAFQSPTITALASVGMPPSMSSI
jgi:hypothetical protein